MDKAILVINMPEECLGCPCFDEHEEWCNLNTRKYIPMKVYVNSKPNWCPLKPIPDKMSGNDSIYYQWGDYEDGWNHCIDSLIDT